ncbi:DUF3426 domain-containing protein [Streptomyces bambusae]|uniref:DUF3426 domain-containing protein n=1 Tax=Streptomyces bambusae TaxID=1550616 RepID=UPI001CFFFEC7|nr:DUF3426 domain-containing protein [Streptomyces bambusae]MCB5170076.1 DUF3426 domain-containing protein [Streptomyces bambusae]
MSIRSTKKARQGVAAAVSAAALLLAVTGCGENDKPESSAKPPGSSAPKKQESTNQPSTAGGQDAPVEVLAEIKGSGGAVLAVNEVKRDAGGFLTVSGTIRNDSKLYVNPQPWAGIEVEVVTKNPNSVAGATLVDQVGKKRYYILRDTDGRCLCTTGLTTFQPGKSQSFFMQFPAPPEGTNEVDFTLPTFATATLKISG